jgi:hypothetical protein
MKAVGYVTRLEGHSIRRQQDDIRSRFAATYRIHWHSDYGLKDESVRPELAELVSDALEEGTESVLVANFRCFAETSALRAAIAGVITGFGLTIETAQRDALEESRIADAISATVSGIIELLKARGLMGAKSRRSQPGPKPYGLAKGSAAANHEREVRGEIFRLRAAGWGLGRIAKKLNANGERTRRRCLWHPQSVARVLDSEP